MIIKARALQDEGMRQETANDFCQSVRIEEKPTVHLHRFTAAKAVLKERAQGIVLSSCSHAQGNIRNSMENGLQLSDTGPRQARRPGSKCQRLKSQHDGGFLDSQY